MSFITRGFSGRSRDRDDRLPPGQTLVSDFPVLSAGPTPEVETEDWEFTIRTESGVHRWNWDEFMALKIDDVDTDIHCVTHWSKLGTRWRGVSLDTLFENVENIRRFPGTSKIGSAEQLCSSNQYGRTGVSV